SSILHTPSPILFPYTTLFRSIPFAIWFFLAIEGVANVAEEAIDPQRTILVGFGSAILTLVILCMLTFGCSAGVAGWEAIVYKAEDRKSTRLNSSHDQNSYAVF